MRCSLGQAPGEHSNEVLDGDLVAAIVDLDIRTVHVNHLVLVVEHGARSRIARVARHIIGKHQNYVAI